MPTSRTCFNPCSRGCCSVARASRRIPGIEASSFNPCSRGCCSVAADRPGRRRPHGGFNPCSRGCCSVASAMRAPRRRRTYGFNPCSRGCCSVATAAAPDACAMRFQSLFSWMLLSGTTGPAADLQPLVVSILVLVDVAQWPGLTAREPVRTRMFQSLFSWMLLSGSGVPTVATTRWSFNPCSRGCCSVADATALEAQTRSSFNPCSRGCCSVAGRARSRRPIERCVSILVLVDVAQWPSTARWTRMLMQRFQSLFSWMLLSGRSAAARAIDPSACFNPCSRGCCSVATIGSGSALRLGRFQSLFSWMLLSGAY